MTLKAVVTNLDDVPENLREEYTEVTKDGKTTYHLDLDSTLQTHSSILPLANSLRNAKNEKAALQTQLNEMIARVGGLPDDFDADKYQTVLAELEALKKDPGHDKDTETKLQSLREQYEQRLRDADKRRETELAAKDQEIAQLNGEMDTSLVETGLTESLVKSGVAKEFLGATRAMLKSVVKTKKDENDKRIAFVETDLGEVPVDKYIESWTATDEGKPFVVKGTGGGGKGSGNGGSTEVNPWAKDTVNVTAQGAIVRADRAKAERMMKAAGRPAHEITQVIG